jgi:anti-sigma B factor antagonist
VLRLRCLACGLTVPYKGSAGDFCPRCLVREERAVALIPVSDRPSRGATMGNLRIHASAQGERHTIVPSGELDVSSAPMLEEAIADACSAGAKELVLEMSGIEFMDSTGLRAILHGKDLCEKHGCQYRLTPAQRPVEQTLTMMGVRSRLPFRRTGRARGPAVPKPATE